MTEPTSFERRHRTLRWQLERTTPLSWCYVWKRLVAAVVDAIPALHMDTEETIDERRMTGLRSVTEGIADICIRQNKEIGEVTDEIIGLLKR